MNDEKYDIVYSGEILPEFEQQQVAENLAALFKLPTEQGLAHFFGGEVSIKKGVSVEIAKKYRSALTKAGAKARYIKHNKPEPELVADSKATAENIKVSSTPQTATTDTNTTSHDPATAHVTSTDSAESKTHASTKEAVDSNEPSLRPNNGPLVDPAETASTAPPVKVDIAHLTLAEANGMLLKESERKPADEPLTAPDFELL